MASIPTFPTIDLSGFDLASAASSVRNTVTEAIPSIDTDELVDALRDAAYIAIGFGVVTVQQAQVRRRELAAAVGQRIDTTSAHAEHAVSFASARAEQALNAVRGLVRQAV